MGWDGVAFVIFGERPKGTWCCEVQTKEDLGLMMMKTRAPHTVDRLPGKRDEKMRPS